MNEKKPILKAILDTPKPLSDDQKEAVTAEDRYLRIVAGAGAGKTETLTRRIAYLLLYKDEEPQSIVAFTFTERAAQSMKNRVYERVTQLKGPQACARLGEMYIGTIHAFCLRLLEDYFGYGDHEALDENQEMAFLMRVGWSLGLGVGGRYAENCRNFLRSVNIVYDELIDRKLLNDREPDFARHLEQYERLLREHRLLTFGQMISLAVEKMDNYPEVLQHVKYLIVDEYQDINRAQEKLIRIIGNSASVFIVGDPRQSIYQWRGSDERCFDDFLNYFPNCHKVEIKENRRSTRAIVKSANTFANSFERVKYEPLKHTRDEEGQVFLVECDTPNTEAVWLAKQVNNLVSNQSCNYSDIAILLRSVSTSAEPFLEAFKMCGFPFLVGGKVGLFQRDEAQAVGRLFSWLSDSGFWIEDPWNWWDRTEDEELLDTAIESWQVVHSKRYPIKQLRRKLENWKKDVLAGNFSNFTEIYQELLEILGFLEFDPDNKLDAACMANLGRFNSLLTDYESSIRRGGNSLDWEQIVKGLCWYMNSYATGAYEEQPAEDLRGIDALQVMTVHQAKGLEWPIVFLPCLVSRRFPSSKAGTEQSWYVPRELFDAARYDGGIEDERRLFYVAMTRAKDILCISRFQRMNNSRSPSIFIRPIEKTAKKLSESGNLPKMQIPNSTSVDEMRTFSAGEIITYLKCPYLYKLREMWGYQPGLVPELGYGKSLHHCLRRTSESIKKGVRPQQAVHEAVSEGFHLPYAHKFQKEKMQKFAERHLTKFVKNHSEDMANIEEVESRLEFPLERATITGKVDVIIREGDEAIEVRDYKTSDTVTTTEQSGLQVKLYALGLQTIGRKVVKGSVAYLEDRESGYPDIDPIEIDDKSLMKAKEIAKECIKGIITGSFNHKASEYCTDNCDYPRICRGCSPRQSEK